MEKSQDDGAISWRGVLDNKAKRENVIIYPSRTQGPSTEVGSETLARADCGRGFFDTLRGDLIGSLSSESAKLHRG